MAGDGRLLLQRLRRTGAWKKDWLFPEKVGLKSAFSQPSPPEKG
jgi:hypothetical protein